MKPREKRCPAHWNPSPKFGLRERWPARIVRARYMVEPLNPPRVYAAVRRFQRLMRMAQVDGWGFP